MMLRKIVRNLFYTLTVVATVTFPLYLAHAQDEYKTCDEIPWWKQSASCLLTGTDLSPAGVAFAIINALTTIPLKIAQFLVGLSGEIFEYTLTNLLLDMSSWINQIDAIKIVWGTLRDIANLGLIFILLAAAISTIVGSAKFEAKKVIPSLIAVAILLNFSFFFTQVLIDATNYLSVQIYNKVEVTSADSIEGDQQEVETEKLTTAFLNTTKAIQAAVTNSNKDLGSSAPPEWVINILNSILLFILAFLFLAASLMLIARFGLLLAVLATSPIAIAAFLFPKTNRMKDWWMNTWIHQSIWPPVYLLIIALSLQVINDEFFYRTLLEPKEEGIAKYAGLIVNYILVAGTLIGALFAAKTIGAVGASKAISIGKSITQGTTRAVGGGAIGAVGWMGRRTFGGGASNYLRNNRNRLLEQRSKGGIRGFLADKQIKALERTEKASFDARHAMGKGAQPWLGEGQKGGFAQRKKDEEKRTKENMKALGEMTEAEKEAHIKALKEHEEEVRKKKDEQNSAIQERTAAVSAEIDELNDQKKEILQQKKQKKISAEEARAQLALINTQISEKNDTRRATIREVEKEFEKEFEKLDKKAPKSAGEERQNAYKKRLEDKKTPLQRSRDFVNRHVGAAQSWTRYVTKRAEEHEQSRKATEAKIEKLIKDNKKLENEYRAAVDEATRKLKREQIQDNNKEIQSLEKAARKAENWSIRWRNYSNPFEGEGDITEDQAKTIHRAYQDRAEAKRRLRAARVRAAEFLSEAERKEVEADAVSAQNAINEANQQIRNLREQNRINRKKQGYWLNQERANAAADEQKNTKVDSKIKEVQNRIDNIRGKGENLKDFIARAAREGAESGSKGGKKDGDNEDND